MKFYKNLLTVAAFFIIASYFLDFGQNKKREIKVYILVHGAFSKMIMRPGLRMLFEIALDKLDGGLYKKATHIMRNDPFFRESQPIQNLGLQKIKRNNTIPGETTEAFAQIIDQQEDWICNNNKQEKSLYYTFGWSGLLSKKERINAAEKLNQSFFHDEIEKLKKQGYIPKVCVIGFSHGTRVVSNLAFFKGPKIDEFVLIGGPFNKKTENLIRNPRFKKVYNFYTKSDRVQRYAFLSLKEGLFTRKKSVNRRGYKAPENLTQIQFDITRKRKKPTKWFQKKVAWIKKIFGITHKTETISPGHIELCCFGWSSRDYRKDFPIKPLAAVTLLPSIIKAVEVAGNEKGGNYNVSLELDQEKITVKIKGKIKGAIDFSKNKLDQLKKIGEKFSVQPKSQKEVNQRVEKAIAQARKELGT